MTLRPAPAVTCQPASGNNVFSCYGEALTSADDYGEAVEVLSTVLPIREELSAKDPLNKQALVELAPVETPLAEALSKSEQASRGNEMAPKALVEFQSLVAFDPGNMV